MMTVVKRKAPEAVGEATGALKQKQLSSFFSGSTGARPQPVGKFDKQKWVDGLDASQRDLLKLEIETMDESWLAVVKDELTKPYFLDLKRFLARERQGKSVFPPDADVYSWSRHTPLHTVKVVIMGQDPYHNHNQAHGLCFSVRKGVKTPPSLQNIYKALAKDYPTFRTPGHGYLMPWADQGVLLLNACLTVRAHEANSHNGRGWEEFTSQILKAVANTRKSGVVFLSWGTPAAKRLQGLNLSHHHVLKSVHPSPLSASRGFFDCQHFVKANAWLRERYGDAGTVNWDCLSEEPAKPVAKSLPMQAPGPAAAPSKPIVPPPAAAVVEDDLDIPEPSQEETEAMLEALSQGEAKIKSSAE